MKLGIQLSAVHNLMFKGILLLVNVLILMTACGFGQKAKTTKLVTLKGQIVCSGCWQEADRSNTPFGTEADMECAASCTKKGIPAALSVKDWTNSSFNLYKLEPGASPESKNWLPFMAKQVEIKGRLRQVKSDLHLKVDNLKGLESQTDHAKDVAPQLLLQDLNGVETSLNDTRGKIVVLNFWAQWCGPCRREMEILQRVAAKYKAEEVVFIAASLDEPHDYDLVRKYVRDVGLKLQVWVGATKNDKRRFGFPSAIPSTAVIDRRGNIVWRYNSVVRESELSAVISRLLKRKRSS